MASGSEKRQLPQMVSVRMTRAEQDAWQQRARDAGLSIGVYVRSVVNGTPAPRPRRQRQPVKDEEKLLQVLAQLGKLGGNVNQLAHAAHRGTGPQACMLAQACADIRAMRDVLMQALGRERRDEGGG